MHSATAGGNGRRNTAAPGASEQRCRTIRSADTGSKGTLLVMDDDHMVGSVIRAMLRRSGYRMHLTWTGDEAVREFESAHIRRKPFDAVILDLNVPAGLQGDQAMTQIRGMDPSVKAILLTGDITHSAVSDYEEIGFRTVLLKPFTREELLHAIHVAINGDQAP